jgi:hypothetical protein
MEGFRNFLDNGRRLRVDLIPLFVATLQQILKWFEEQRLYRFYSSSLLFVYEGNEPDELNHNRTDEISLTGNGKHAGEVMRKKKMKMKMADIRMIDFAHVTPATDGRADEGYIHGLKKTISCLENLLQQANNPLETKE